MTLPELITTTVATVTTALSMGGTEITKAASKDVYNWVKNLFTSQDKAHALEVLEKKPDDTREQIRVEVVLEEILKQNTQLIPELTALVEAAKAEQINNSNNTSHVQGNNNNVIQGVNNSHINIGNTNQHHTGSGDNVAGNKIINDKPKD